MEKMKCGNANSKGNISLFYLGSCKKELNIDDAYRCTGCDGWFHKECIKNHFKMEKKHDWGREAEKKLMIKKIKKARMWKLVPNTPRMIMCSDKELNNLLNSL
jgi:hypothetical protein